MCFNKSNLNILRYQKWMFLHFFIMKSQFVDPLTINSKEDVITFQNTRSKCHVPEMKRHSPVINQVSPPGVYQCLITSTRTGRQLLMAKFRKTTQRQVLPWKKKYIFFLLIAWKEKIIFLNFIFIGKMMKRLWRKAYSFAKWYMCVLLEEFHNLLVEKLEKVNLD